MNKLIQFSSKFIIDPSCIKAIAPLAGSSRIFTIFTDRQSINIDYDEFKSLRKYLLENALMTNLKGSENED